MSYLEELKDSYYHHFCEFWLPIYRKQVLDAKYDNNTKLLLEIKTNILKNWHLEDYKILIIEKLGLKYLEGIN